LSPNHPVRQRAEWSDLPVMPIAMFVYPAIARHDDSLRSIFTESLILAQDERWRRA
jgi:hypothetical protein